MANKKKTDTIIKDRIIRVRVTQGEHEKFIEKSAQNGYKSVSDFIRTLITDDAK